MAGIDKIYGSNEQWYELFDYLRQKRPQYLKWLYPPFGYPDTDRPISNFPVYADRWLWDNCPLLWVIDRLEYQYGGKRP